MYFLIIISGLTKGIFLLLYLVCFLVVLCSLNPFLIYIKSLKIPQITEENLLHTLLIQDPKVVRANDKGKKMSPGDQLYLLPVIAYPDRSAGGKQY